MDKFAMLQELGAGDFQHLNGTLEARLKGTEKVLMDWGSSELLEPFQGMDSYLSPEARKTYKSALTNFA